MGRAKTFLAYYNKIEKTLESLYTGPEEHMSFYELIQTLRRTNRQVAYFADELHEYRTLRNAIVHDTVGDMVIAEPCETVVVRIRKIHELLTKPALVMDLCKGQEVVSLTLNDSLQQVLSLIRDTGYSQFPVIDCKRVIGILTSHTAASYLADRMQGNELIIDKATVSDLFRVSDDKEDFMVIARTSTVYDVSVLIRKYPKVSMFIVTESGKPTQHLLGVLTAADFHRVYGMRN